MVFKNLNWKTEIHMNSSMFSWSKQRMTDRTITRFCFDRVKTNKITRPEIQCQVFGRNPLSIHLKMYAKTSSRQPI